MRVRGRGVASCRTKAVKPSTIYLAISTLCLAAFPSSAQESQAGRAFANCLLAHALDAGVPASAVKAAGTLIDKCAAEAGVYIHECDETAQNCPLAAAGMARMAIELAAKIETNLR
jgi:hypothetical protein